MFYLRGLVLLVLGALLAFGQVVPGRFIVELNGAPASSLKDRPRIQASQQSARWAIEQAGAQVLTSISTVANALVVEGDGATASRLSQIPGVRKVHPVMELHAVLDAALPLHKVPDAWAKIGGADNAGAGVKIGIIDSGIDPDQPGFKDPSMKAPDGYPKVSQAGDEAYTSGKIIVARSYENLFRRTTVDPGIRDQHGHGTGVAMAAAGVPVDGLLGRLSGVAPKAWLGVYRITRGSTGSSTSDVMLKALDDAIADGMEVINISYGVDVAISPADDAASSAIERAVSLGVMVVLSAGNNGPDPNTISSPATAPAALTVGASYNAREYGAPVTLDDGKQYVAIPGNGPNSDQPISAKLIDVPGLGCDPLPDNSMAGAVALILRGDCFFEVKLNNAAAAGAVAAIVRTDAARPDAIPMDAGKATLPAVMVSYADGAEIQSKLSAGTVASVTVGFKLGPVAVDPNRIGYFSAAGPDTDDATIKPDMVAAGVEIYTATQTLFPLGEMYDESGYTVVSGTSFASPIVAGAAAVLKAARPGLTAEQYKSLLTGSTIQIKDGRVQTFGSGALNLAAALDSTIAAVPASLSFGSGSGDPDARRSLKLVNLSSAEDTFTVTALPWPNQPAPTLSASTLTVAANETATLDAAFTGSSLTAGEYQGFLVVRSTNSGVESRIPYWYGVKSSTAARVTLLYSDQTGSPDEILEDSIVFRLTDASGANIAGGAPKVSVVSGDGKLVDLADYTSVIPGTWSITLQLGPVAGPNVFRIEAGDVKRDVTIMGQ